MDHLPRREIPLEERIVAEEHAQKKQQEKKLTKLETSKKIRCPACKKNQYFEKYFSNTKIGCLVCGKCGNMFVDPWKLRDVKLEADTNTAKANQELMEKASSIIKK